MQFDNNFIFVLIGLIIFFSLFCKEHFNQNNQISKYSDIEKCTNIAISNGEILADCKNDNNKVIRRSNLIFTSCPKDNKGKYWIKNNNGTLNCGQHIDNKQIAPISFVDTCVNIKSSKNSKSLTADCYNNKKKIKNTTLNNFENCPKDKNGNFLIENNDGKLQCMNTKAELDRVAKMKLL